MQSGTTKQAAIPEVPRLTGARSMPVYYAILPCRHGLHSLCHSETEAIGIRSYRAIPGLGLVLPKFTEGEVPVGKPIVFSICILCMLRVENSTVQYQA